MIAAAITKGDLYIDNVQPRHLLSLSEKLSQMGTKITHTSMGIRVNCSKRTRAIGKIETQPYPGFPTDAGPLLVASLIKAKGTSVFTENIFENRFNYIGELRRLGADIKVFGKVAVIEGVDYLRSAYLSCTDLRGGAAAAIALLGSDGVGVLDNISHIERGYENFEGVLSGVSAKIVKE